MDSKYTEALEEEMKKRNADSDMKQQSNNENEEEDQQDIEIDQDQEYQQLLANQDQFLHAFLQDINATSIQNQFRFQVYQ